MKWPRFLSSGLIALTMSVGVTAGSIYVTVSAAAGNSAAVSAVNESSIVGAPVSTSATIDAAFSDVSLKADGSLTARFSGVSILSGKLEPAADVKVTLISVDGTRTTTSTDADGFCGFEELTPGLYTINAEGPQGKLSYGIRAVSGNLAVAEKRSGEQAVPVSIRMAPVLDSALTPARDANSLDNVINSVVVTPVEDTAAASGGTATETSSVAAGMRVTDTYLRHESIQLNLDGSLLGQLALLDPVSGNITPVKDLTVSFISDDEVVAITTVNPDGSFVQANLLPGIYSMVVVGRDAIGYIGIEVLGQVAPANKPGLPIPTSARSVVPFQFALLRGAGAMKRDNADDEETVEEIEIVEDSATERLFPSGGAVSGGGPGGGGVSGGGGLAGLLGLGGLAGLAGNDSRGPSSPAF